MLFCRLQDSPPPINDTAAASSDTPDVEPQRPAPQKKPEKVLFGVRAKPLKVVAKKKSVVADQAVATAATNGSSQSKEQQNGDTVPAKSHSSGDAAGGLLGLGSYGSESD